MNKNPFFVCKYKNIEISACRKDFITIISEAQKYLIDNLIFDKARAKVIIDGVLMDEKNLYEVRKDISFVLNRHLNIFIGETVKDEISFGLESLSMTKDDMLNKIHTEAQHFKLDEFLEKDPKSLGSSDKAKLKILCSYITNPKIIVIDEIFDELDYRDSLYIIKILNKFVENGGIVLNFTKNIEQSLNGNKIIITDREKNLIEGKTLSVLNEEKLLKRLNISLPFMIELNKYFIDYGLTKNYILDYEKLVNKLWK